MKQIPKHTGYFTSYDDTRIYYEVRGEGAPLIFCYGIGCLINHWQFQLKYFSENYQTIVFDYRAHHKSQIPRDPENLTLDALARDIQGLSQHLNLKPASFLGHSFGAQVLIRTFDMFPELFHNLVFINGFAQNPLDGMFGTDLASSVFRWVKRGYGKLPETSKYLWRVALDNPLAVRASAMAGGFNLQLAHLKDVEIYWRAMASADLPSFLKLFENMMGYDGRSVLERIDVPVLLISGSQDALTPESMQEEMFQKMKHSQKLLVPYGSHCTQLDMPDFVNLSIENFLTKVKYT
jgi:pimeloyl-ACP methyl ester carboxylesterase